MDGETAEGEHTSYRQYFRILGYLVSKWYEGEENIKELHVIEFDKLITFVRRFWQAFYSPDNEGTVSFGLDNLKIVPAKHGRRVAKGFDNEARYVLQMLYNLQENGFPSYLQIVPPRENDDLLKDTKLFLDGDIDELAYLKDAENYKTIVKPFARVTKDIDQHFSDLKKNDLKIIHALEKCLTTLYPDAIRAIGTHCNCEETIEDINKEFIDPLKRHDKPLSTLVFKMESGLIFYDEAYKVLTYMSEAYRKSTIENKSYKHNKSPTNEPHYREAFEKVKVTFNGLRTDQPEILETFEKLFSEPDLIWKDDRVLELSKVSTIALGLFKCITALGFFTKYRALYFNPKTKEERLHSKIWDEGYELLNVNDIPNNIVACFVGNDSWEIQPKLMAYFIQRVKNFIDWIEKEYHEQ